MRYRVKLFPEIVTKSRPVRREMVRHLRTNIRNALDPISPRVRVSDHWDVLEVRPRTALDAASREALETRLGGISGIHEIQIARSLKWHSFADVAAHLVPLWRNALATRRFRVSVKRRGDHTFSSEALERYLGAALIDAAPAARVDLKHPEIDVRVEVRDDTLTLIERRLPGLGGYPMGTQGAGLALISGGYDSPVAAWQLMRRGLKTHFLYFDLGGADQEYTVREAAHRLWQQYGASHRVDFISVPFVEVMHEIQRAAPAGVAGVILKRQMIRAANRLAARLRVNALITGDALAQVSSQSLINLGLIDAVTERPVLRPLIASDKASIIDQARRIGTAALAEGLPEVCGTISRRPNTRPRAQAVESAEAALDPQVLDTAVAAARITRSDRLRDSRRASSAFTSTSSSAGTSASAGTTERDTDSDIRSDAGNRRTDGGTSSRETSAPRGDTRVIDIRHPDEREAAPLTLPDNETPLLIPYFDLASRAGELPRDGHYRLYCAQGTMSRLQVEHLAAQGFDNFTVYSPAAEERETDTAG
ncbi:tRNA uracil 4-sulfurtransferase ThiI [Salinicola avicenniae]|uniref:tRNA uracil 4-sulfurtransferase ThiI n=1 Tax=Salinicola avicenniae TaxID=2916836 RepID=UPI0020743986|nr:MULTISPECIES: tRNA uracil 4-sulfurtransferase ThiI [unclassified Salinicola]